MAATLHCLDQHVQVADTTVVTGSATTTKILNSRICVCLCLFCRLLARWPNLESLCNFPALYTSGSYHKGTVVPMHTEQVEAKAWCPGEQCLGGGVGWLLDGPLAGNFSKDQLQSNTCSGSSSRSFDQTGKPSRNPAFSLPMDGVPPAQFPPINVHGQQYLGNILTRQCVDCGKNDREMV